jgi:hypothetical protein
MVKIAITATEREVIEDILYSEHNYDDPTYDEKKGAGVVDGLDNPAKVKAMCALLDAKIIGIDLEWGDDVPGSEWCWMNYSIDDFALQYASL